MPSPSLLRRPSHLARAPTALFVATLPLSHFPPSQNFSQSRSTTIRMCFKSVCQFLFSYVPVKHPATPPNSTFWMLSNVQLGLASLPTGAQDEQNPHGKLWLYRTTWTMCSGLITDLVAAAVPVADAPQVAFHTPASKPTPGQGLTTANNTAVPSGRYSVTSAT